MRAAFALKKRKARFGGPFFMQTISDKVRDYLLLQLPRTGEVRLFVSIIAKGIEDAVEARHPHDRKAAEEWVDDTCGYYCRYIGLDREWPHTVMDALRARV